MDAAKRRRELKKYSDITRVRKNAKDIYGDVVVVEIADKADKKYMIRHPKTGKKIYFGAWGMEDFTKHKDPERQYRYLKRSMAIKGKWKEDPFSPNNLAIFLLWM